MSTNHLPLIAIGPGCTAAPEIPDSVDDGMDVSAPYPAVMYTPTDLEFAVGSDVGRRAGGGRGRRGGGRRARHQANSYRRKRRQDDVCVSFFRSIWYGIKLLLWDLPCCFLSCGQGAVDCFQACRDGDSSDEGEWVYDEPPAAKRSRRSASVDERINRLRAEVDLLRQESQGGSNASGLP